MMRHTRTDIPLTLETFDDQQAYVEASAAQGEPWVVLYGRGEAKLVIGRFRTKEIATELLALDCELSDPPRPANSYVIHGVREAGDL